MPIFEFECSECGYPFEELLRNAGAVESLCCPRCGSPQIRKKLSSFAAKVSRGNSFSIGSGPGPSCNTGGT